MIYYMNFDLHCFIHFYTIPLIDSLYFLFGKSSYCRYGVRLISKVIIGSPIICIVCFFLQRVISIVLLIFITNVYLVSAEAVEFDAMIAEHLYISSAVACQLKTISIKTSFTNTVVNMKKLTIKKTTNISPTPSTEAPPKICEFWKI